MLRRLSVALALCLLSMAGSVHALGLGTIKVGSALNQRFSAVIPFTSLSPDEAANVRARIADNADFARAGLDRSAYVSSVQVEVIAEGPNPRMVLTSREIVREPLLNLLIEVRTPGGPRILRQYTVLLDPPGATTVSGASEAPAASQAAPSSQGEFFFQTPEETVAPVARAPRTEAPRPARAAAESGRYGPIQSGETLSTVVQSVRPEGVSTEQAMLALFETNRSAFINGDIDLLRRGASFDVPSAEQMRAVSTSDARARLQALSAAGSDAGSAPASAPAPAEPATTTAPVPAESATAPTAEPDATATDATAPSTEDAGSSSDAASGAAPESAEGASAAGVDGGDTSASADPAQGAAETAAVEGSTSTDGAETPAVDSLAEEPMPAEGEAVEPAASEPAEAAAQGDWISSYLLPALIALIVLLIAVAAWRTARERKAQREYEDAARNPAPMPAPRPGATGSLAAKAATAGTARDELEALNRRIDDEDATRIERADDDATRVSAPETPEQVRMVTTSRIPPYTGPQAADRPLSEDEQAVTSQFARTTKAIDLGDNDPLAESEFHLAYGLYEEAALLLQQASARAPERTDLRVKLAETYFAAGKAKEFEQTAETLKGQVSADEWNKIAIMGRQILPGAAMFAGASGGDTSGTLLDLSLDDDATQIAPVKVDEGLEFNLEELELPTQAAGKGGAASNTLEFDLGEFDLGGSDKTKKPATPNEINLQEFDLGDSTLVGGGKGGMDLSLDDLDPQVINDPLDDEGSSAGDDAATKLDLARAYVEMGDAEMARSLLDEVSKLGSDDQKREAGELRSRLLG